MKKFMVLLTATLFALGLSGASFAVDAAQAEGPGEWAAKKVGKKIEDKVLAKKRANEAKAAEKKKAEEEAAAKKKQDEAYALAQEKQKAEKEAWIKAKIAKGESPHMTAAEIKRRKINRQWIVY